MLRPEDFYLVKLRIPVPKALADALGYEGQARYVAAYWDPAWNKVTLEDGFMTFTGEAQTWQTYVGHPVVSGILDHFNLGSSEEASQWLVIDRRDRKVYVGFPEKVLEFLQRQHLDCLNGHPSHEELTTEECHPEFVKRMNDLHGQVQYDLDLEAERRRV